MSTAGPIWWSQSVFNKPNSAYVRYVEKMPYIGDDGAAFDLHRQLYEEARQLWTLLEVVGAGQPLVFGFWFEYADPDLELASFENYNSWSFPEVTPRIETAINVSGNALRSELEHFFKLNAEWQHKLLRSADRFILSQCRREPVDRVLDLVLAFEIAVSGRRGDNAPASWKVAVRTAQMIGGGIATRLDIRKKISQLYGLRSKATHGSDLNDKDLDQIRSAVSQAAQSYRPLLQSLMRHGKQPDWLAVEMETPSL